MAEEQWYYSSHGRQLGPVTREMLRSLIVTAQVRETDMVWTPGMTQWAAAQMVPHLMKAATPLQQGYGSERVYVEYAGFWRRFVAWLIDVIVLAVLIVVAGMSVLLVMSGYATNLDPATLVRQPTFIVEITLCIAIGLLTWLYYAGMESSSYQATLGKLAIGIFVTDQSGADTSFLQASARFFGKFFSAAILMFGFLMAGWTRRKQALHDFVAGTVVVRKR